jgi:hypothetical protein
MKWSKEKDDLLKELSKQEKTHKEIAKIFGVSYKSIHNRCYRIGVKDEKIYHKEIKCKECGVSFEVQKCSKMIFCSQTCSGTYNGKRRKHSKETKIKIGAALKEIASKKEKKTKIKKEIIRYCSKCSHQRVFGKKTICNDCKLQYYDYYRPFCEFVFSLNDYPKEFDLTLINKLGFYSPSNKNNNLSGVSRDHLYSVYDGFKNKVSPDIIKHPANCRLVIHTDNQKKKTKSIISLEELKQKIEEWDKKYCK